jgi:hypothetical protein
LVVLAAVAACGRVGFDPLADGAGTSAPSVDGRAGDGRAGDGASMSTPLDAANANACAAAISVDVNAPKTVSTCDGGAVGCGTPQSVYFVFTAPASAGYQFAAYDSGTMNVSSSTGRLNATCTALGSASACAGILGLSLNQNDTIYLTVTANSGCEMIDFTVTSS